MLPILRVRDSYGNVVHIPAIVGRKGDPGKTPVRGVDYWTPEDKAEIAGEVLGEAAASAKAAVDSAVNAARLLEQTKTAAAETAAAAKKAQSAETNVALSAEVATKAEAAAGASAEEAKTSETASKAAADNAKSSEESAAKSEAIAKEAVLSLVMMDSASGQIASMTDAAAMSIVGFTVNDDTEPESLKVLGKNFFHRQYDTGFTDKGITVTWDAENQEFVFNGTYSSAGDLQLVVPLLLDWIAGEKYTVSVRRVSGTAVLPEGSTGNTYAWSIFQSDLAKHVRGATGNTNFPETYSFTATAFVPADGKTLRLYFQCWKTGTVFTDYRVKIQIESGSKVTDWEPYTEQKAAIADAQTLVLNRGNNNVLTVPSADITVDYAVDTKLYIDQKIAEALGT